MSAHATSSLTPAQVRQVAMLLIPTSALVLAAFIAARLVSSIPMADWLDNLHWTIAYVTAAILAWYGVQWADEHTRAARRWFAYGLTTSAIGQLLWDVQTALQWTGYPAPSDLLFLCFGPCCVWGMLHTIRNRAQTISRTLILDATTGAVVILAIVLALYLPRQTGPGGIGLVFMVVYPICMLTSSCLALVMWPTLRLKVQYQWLVFVVASIINGILWMQWIYLSQEDAVTTNTWLYLLFSLCALALGVGAMLWRVESSQDPISEHRCEAVLRMLPLLVIGGAAVSVGLAWSMRGFPPAAAMAIYVSAALVFVLAAIRQSLLLFELQRLLVIEKRNGELERTFKTLFLITRGGLAMLDKHGRFRECNPSCVQLLGYTHDELLQMNIRDLGTANSVRLSGALGLVDEHGSGIVETDCRRKDGGLMQVEMTSALIPDSDGQVFVIFRDITQRKHANEQLQLMAQRLAIATRSAGIGIWEYQLPSNTLVWDAQMHQLYGTRPEEFAGNYADWEQRNHPDDRVRLRQLYLRAVADECEYHTEFRIVRSDGSIRHLESWADTQINAATGVAERLIGVTWDITERKQSEAAHLRLEAQLRQSQKLEAIGTLASGIAHDFNNILGAILGNIELALQDIDARHPAVTSMQEIRKAGQRARELIRRIVAFGKPHELNFQPLQLAAVVEDAMKLVRATLPATVDINYQFPANLPLVKIDSSQIAQVLLNLCTNAYQAMENQKGRIDITLDLHDFSTASLLPDTELQPGRYVCLHVKDTGMGIESAIADRIFEPFFTTKAVGEGSGLGLSIVHNIVRSHAGAITLESECGKGTTFHLYLPVVAGSEPSESPQTLMRPSIATGTGQHILYVDDEEALVFLTTRMLQRFGYKVSGFTDARAALTAALAADANFDLVITDHSMPGMSGIDFAREILSQRPTSRIVLVSGYLQQAQIEQARALGIKEVMLKPDTIDELAATVHRLLSKGNATPNVDRDTASIS